MASVRSLKFAAPLMLASGTALAQQSAGDPTQLVRDVSSCRAVASREERLACFDKAAAPLGVALDDNRLIILNRAAVVERRRARFGLAMEDAVQAIGPGATDEAIGELRELTSTITASAPSGYDRYSLVLANGSVWQTVEPIRFPPRTGQSITIRAAALGTFKASIADRLSVKVKRIR